jgi:hypothetical protein
MSDRALRRVIRAGGNPGWPLILKTYGFATLEEALRAVIMAPVAVAIHRFILLGEVRRFYFFSPATLRFAAWIFALWMPVEILSWNGDLLSRKSTMAYVIFSVLQIGLTILWVAMMRLFPAIAVEERQSSILERVEAALEHGKGMFWLSLTAVILACLPPYLFRTLINMLPYAKTNPCRLFNFAIYSVSTIVLFAAIASILYGYAANRAAAGPTLLQRLFPSRQQ